MRFSVISAVAALVSVVSADLFDAIQTPAQDEILTPGTPFQLVWTANGVTGKATIVLLEGATNTSLQLGPVIAQSIDNTLGSFSWTPVDRGFATYGWQISLDSDPSQLQYSSYFHIKSNASDTTSTSSTTTVQLSTGPSYTSTATSTRTSSSTVTATTSVAVSNTTVSVPVTTSLVTKTSSPTTTSSKASSTSTSSSTPTTTSTSNSAVANMAAHGGLAVIGGLVLALAL